MSTLYWLDRAAEWVQSCLRCQTPFGSTAAAAATTTTTTKNNKTISTTKT
jgi:hypothetical protein